MSDFYRHETISSILSTSLPLTHTNHTNLFTKHHHHHNPHSFSTLAHHEVMTTYLPHPNHASYARPAVR